MNPLYVTGNQTTSFPNRKSVGFSYEELSKLYAEFVLLKKSKDQLFFDEEKTRRILLLGKAFKEELKNNASPLAEKLFNTWLLGPQMDSFSSFSEEVRLNKDYGRGFNFGNEFSNQPWMRLRWEDIQSKSVDKLTKLAETEALSVFGSSNGIPEKLKNQIKEEVSKKVSQGAKTGWFGDINPESLSYPKYVLIAPDTEQTLVFRMSLYKVLYEEADLGSVFLFGGKSPKTKLIEFLTLPYNIRLPDIAASLGSMNLFTYVKGSFELFPPSKPQKAKLRFTHFGYRIVDSYDFNDHQPLGCWYPEGGHDTKTVILTLLKDGIAPAIGKFILCTLTDGDFRDFATKFKPIFNEFLLSKVYYQLRCNDYFLITPMKVKELPTNISIEITL